MKFKLNDSPAQKNTFYNNNNNNDDDDDDDDDNNNNNNFYGGSSRHIEWFLGRSSEDKINIKIQ